MPGPGVCCVPDPGGESPTRDRPACGCNLRVNEGCGAGARSQSAHANCGYEFTRSKQVLCPHRPADPQVNIRWLPEPVPSALNWAYACGGVDCGGCDGVRGARAGRRRPTGLAVAAATCGYDGRSTRRRRTGSAATAVSTWPECPGSRCMPPVRGRWCSPVSWRAGRWCRSRIRAACGPATSRSRRRCGWASWCVAGTALGELAAGHQGCPAAGLPALGCDVGPRRQRRLRRSARAAGDHADPAQAPARLSCTASARVCTRHAAEFAANAHTRADTDPPTVGVMTVATDAHRSRPPRFGLTTALPRPAAESREFARAVEAAGFDVLTFPDHLVPSASPFAGATAAAWRLNACMSERWCSTTTFAIRWTLPGKPPVSRR